MVSHQDPCLGLGLYNNLVVETFIRLFLAVICMYLDNLEPFHRKIQPEELWLYKNPRTESYVPTSLLWPVVTLTPLVPIIVLFLIRKDKVDTVQAFLSLSLTLTLNGFLTILVKVIVGRPRPDYFWRCFPDGQSNPAMICTGDKDEIRNGLKSFPSGHSSFAFASLGFASFYLIGKLRIFTHNRGRGQSWRLIMGFSPLIIALTIALSRTCDYHHHWQDILVGSLLGFGIAWLCYRQYYPPFGHSNEANPYVSFKENSASNSSEDMKHLESLQEVSVKWI